jgi:phosphoglycerate dehydrogenase-like enzyme
LGSMVASYGICFGMRVRYFDPYVSESLPGVERIKILEKLVETSDVITVHVHYEADTENLIDKDLFERFKDGAYLINTSRGEVVDHKILLESLQSGKLAGAAVDVLDGEFEVGFEGRILDQPLVKYAAKHDNLIITPHIGGSTIDAWKLTQEYTIRKVIEAIG